jgi:hypothetical protein
MKLDNTPLRTLVKSFSGGVIDREEYLSIRARLLQKLESTGSISDEDLQALLDGSDRQDQPSIPPSRYTRTDWLLILLGLAAATGLAIILYN